MTDKLQRPESFEFALDFLDDPEASELRAYIEQLEARAALAEPVGEGVTDEELKAAYWKAYRQNTIRDNEECFLAALRAIYRWDRPALAEPEPAPPAEGEVE